MFRRNKKQPKEGEVTGAPLFSPDLPSTTSLVYEVGSAEQSLDKRLVEVEEQDRSDPSSEDDNRSLTSLTKLTPAERASSNRRINDLERRSMSNHNDHVSTFEASELDLISLIDKQEWKHVLRRIGNGPKSMSEKQDMELDGKQTQAFPLHLAVSKKPPVNVIDAMLAVYPNACKIPDDTFGQLPLHIACKFRAGGEILKYLLDSFPEAIRLTDAAEGRLPLHYACLDGYPYDISILIAAEKRALTCKDAAGKTPIDLVNESTSPHRDQIIKRIFKIAKADAKKSRRRMKKQLKAPATPLERYEQPPPNTYIESPSELSDMTQEASNLSKISKPLIGKPKSMLPAWARGRQTRTDVDQTPVKRGSSLESPRMRVLLPEILESHFYTRDSSLERPRNRKTFSLNNFPLEALSLPPKTETKPSDPRGLKTTRSREDSVPDIVSNEMERKLLPRDSTGGKKLRSREDSVPGMLSNETERKLKNRTREDSIRPLVPEIASMILPPKSMDLSSLPDAASLPLSLNASIDEDKKEPIPDTAPSPPRRKKKGLATNADLFAFANGEENKLSFYEYENCSDPFPLPLTVMDQSRHQEAMANSMPNFFQVPPLVPKDRKALKTSLLDTVMSSKNEKVSQQSKSSSQQSAPCESPHSRSQQSLAKENRHDSMNSKMPVPKESPHSRSQTSVPKESPHSHGQQSQPSPMQSPNPFPVDKEMVALNAQLHSLELRKAALVEECNHVSETISKRRCKADQDKGKLIEMKLKLMELQQVVDREQAAVDFAESSIKLHHEILCEHVEKIKAADQELTFLASRRNSLIEEKTARLEEPSSAASSSSKSKPKTSPVSDQESAVEARNNNNAGNGSQLLESSRSTM